MSLEKRSSGAGLLDRLEALGNALPDPATLFLIGALLVIGLSHAAVVLDWSVEKTVARPVRVPVLDARGTPLVDPASGEAVTVAVLDEQTGQARRELVPVRVEPRSLLTRDGLYWALASMVDNFKDFPPLAVVLVGMLGIGVAERSGFLPALLKASLLKAPRALLTPLVFFVGVMSSMTLDAGYVVLPPIAVYLYRAAGRSPLAGLAAVFAGVSAGFSANLAITGLEPLLAGFTSSGAQIIDPDYRVAETCNWWFLIASTFLLTALGWGVTAVHVERRLRDKPPEQGGPLPEAAAQTEAQRLDAPQRRGLAWGVAVAALCLAAVVGATRVPGSPLHSAPGEASRWVGAIVPLLFLGFFLPGIAYGLAAGGLRSDRDVARLLGETMASMGPYIVMAFFAAQFIAYFSHSHLGEMLAISGGKLLTRAALPTPLLVIAFVLVVSAGNLLIGSMSAKYAVFAPVFVPMFMQVGISPELTQMAYRIGDSVSNVITPLNPYVVIILVVMRQFMPRAGVGTLVTVMLPYTIVFTIGWTALLLVWMALGVELGPAGPLDYVPEF
jgi:aminobenzoyl-glutamate transport protein